MKKDKAIEIIISSANKYKENLCNKNLLFIYQHGSNVNKIETAFFPRHFCHLTGVDISNSRIKSSVDFYNICLKNKLSHRDFNMKSNGTAVMKLMILPKLMDIKSNANMLGKYNNSKSILITDKIVGSVHACIGFVEENGYYVPNTALKEDSRELISGTPNRVLMIYEKTISDKAYNSIPSYTAKNIDDSLMSKIQIII